MDAQMLILAVRRNSVNNIFMQKTVLIIKRETSNSNRIDSGKLLQLAGFLLKVSVDVAHNIDRNIFVMQRDVSSSYSQNELDTFYSVASVGELEWIPANHPDPSGTSFFRTDTIELMFESKKELEDSWRKISSEVFSLAESNDLSINIEPDLIASYPSDAISLYYGVTNSTPSATEISGLTNLPTPIQDLKHIDTFDGDSYFTVAIPIYTKDRNFYIDNTLALSVKSDMTITNKYDVPIPYKVYTTTDEVPPGLHTITFK